MYALALGAGGVRGCAHIGVLRGLEELGLRPGGIAGASMGALVGALYALGASTQDLAGLDLGHRIRAAIRPHFPRHGLLNPDPLARLVHDLVGTKTFAQAKIPLAITAVDLSADERVVLHEGPVAPAVIASMMVPGVFPPFTIGLRALNDPGVIDSIPVDVAAAFGTDVVVGVSADLTVRGRRPWRRPPVSIVLDHAGRACGLIGARGRWPWAQHLACTLRRMSRQAPDYPPPCPVIWIQPSFGRMSANSFWSCDQAITLGEAAVREAAPRLRSHLMDEALAA
jgi:predicted acylesterase/phospholipase RssA